MIVVDMEEWKRKKIEEKKELEIVEIVSEQSEIHLGMEMQTTGMVVAAPTYEGKRKQQVGGPKGKRRKLEQLVDWGEGEEHDIWEDWLVRKEEMSKKSNWLNSKLFQT
jgi:hypothetical protein